MAAAVTVKLRDDDPANRARLSKGPNRGRVPLPVEFHTLLHSFRPYCRPLFLLVAATGVAVGRGDRLRAAADRVSAARAIQDAG